MTNGERIRSLDDRGLANLMCTGLFGFDCGKCFYEVGHNGRCGMQCQDNCLKWLQQEVAAHEDMERST